MENVAALEPSMIMLLQYCKQLYIYDRFSLSFQIDDLKADLSRPLNLHEPLEGAGFEYGFNSKKLKSVVKFWRDDYLTRWDKRQAFLNSFPQFKTQIQGLQIHYIHVKPQLTKEQQKTKTVLPLLLLHGWPGSVREFYNIIPKLTSPNSKSNYVFEVVVPSLPGYGWSQPASKTGLAPSGMAVIFKNLMKRVGHEQFLIQGGDWGSIITSHMASLFPENVIAAHSNMCGAMGPTSSFKLFIASFFPTYFATPEQIPFHFPVAPKLAYLIEESGYMHIQSTKPDTIGTALTENPVGLLAYILEKFSTWTHGDFKMLADGGFEKKYKLDDLLDNIMIYHLTNSITTSQRIYAENFAKPERDLELERVLATVPYGCARFRHDLFHSLDWQLKDKYTNLVHSTYYPDGGHFAAFEVPDVLYNDFIGFVKKVFSPDSDVKKEL